MVVCSFFSLAHLLYLKKKFVSVLYAIIGAGYHITMRRGPVIPFSGMAHRSQLPEFWPRNHVMSLHYVSGEHLPNSARFSPYSPVDLGGLAGA
jgi:hypothetical protein